VLHSAVVDTGPDLALRVCAMLDDYLALGNRLVESDQARFVTWPETPDVYDANHVQAVRCRGPEEIAEVLARAGEHLRGSGHRYFLCDARTPPEFEARLLLEGYAVRRELELVLEGPLRASRREFDLRPVASEDDWSAVAHLARQNHLDDARRLGVAPLDEAVTTGLVAARRRRAPHERTWLARVEGVDCAFFSSWPGSRGIGKVENLFTLPAFRHRGIATALIDRAVADARERGASAVSIGADPTQTPMHMYVAMGFRPIAVRRGYLRSPA